MKVFLCLGGSVAIPAKPCNFQTCLAPSSPAQQGGCGRWPWNLASSSTMSYEMAERAASQLQALSSVCSSPTAWHSVTPGFCGGLCVEQSAGGMAVQETPHLEASPVAPIDQNHRIGAAGGRCLRAAGSAGPQVNAPISLMPKPFTFIPLVYLQPIPTPSLPDPLQLVPVPSLPPRPLSPQPASAPSLPAPPP